MSDRAPHVRRRPAFGIGIGVLVLIVVAWPAAFMAFASLLSFAGCFLDCSQPTRDPSPLSGVFFAGCAVALLALPVLSGLAAAGVRRRLMGVLAIMIGLVVAVPLVAGALIGAF